MKKVFLLFFLVGFTNLHGKYNLTEFKLKNGLRVICLEKNTSPIVSFSIWYGCGSKCDAVSKSGVAHYLEHMAFCSDKGVFMDFLESVGAEKNAFTFLNGISFYEVIPSEHIEEVFKHESIRMQKIDIDEQKFLSEKGAILEERSMVCDNRPFGQYIESIVANLFNKKIGGTPVIGWKHEIESISPEDLLEFHDKWFAPNNAVVIVVGDITAEHIKFLSEKYFGGIPEKTLSSTRTDAKKPTCMKEVNFSSPKIGAQACSEYVYFVPFTPKTNFRKYIAFCLATKILNQSGFLVKKSLENSFGKSLSIDFQYIHGEFQYDIMMVDISSASINNADESEKAWQYLKRKTLDVCINKSDLDSVKRQSLIANAYKKDDVDQMAKYFGFTLTYGLSTEQIQSIDDVIQSITLDECKEVLKEVFDSAPIAISRITPKGYDRA